ncbi:hypothetical protein RM863_16950 [Streptomyces sp. DSM 41014]|uniref:Uncharacterized protein n=1 Tax=Streptomyces hintoniae TaxID=3075521 RepID=A0ABU2UKZ4_9ACTN|nr:hypothetical protein [Streptomyces sp. DSM 41014]MDT0473818.1 hypothetical protein [Streptomyces sp. DSM 41014]
MNRVLRDRGSVGRWTSRCGGGSQDDGGEEESGGGVVVGAQGVPGGLGEPRGVVEFVDGGQW